MNLNCIYFSATVIFALFTISSGATVKNSINDLATDLENWMSKLPEALKNVPINGLAIPGSHDSFTNDITSKSNVSPDGEDILKKLEFLSIVKVIMANWSITQVYNVLEQLQAGIRFFDLRICRNYEDETNLRFCHGMYSTEVKSVLQDMSSFLNSHPGEVLILDCQHFYNFTDTTHPKLIQFLHDTFGDKLVPYQSDMNSLTLANLAAQKKQVILVYRDSSQNDGQPLLWPDGSFPTPWYNTMDPIYLLSSLDESLKSRPSNSGFISQLILTPDTDDIFSNLLKTLKQMCAVDFESNRSQWISKLTPGQNGVNVIIGDFVDLSDNAFSKAVINLNLKSLEPKTIATNKASWSLGSNFFRSVISKLQIY